MPDCTRGAVTAERNFLADEHADAGPNATRSAISHLVPLAPRPESGHKTCQKIRSNPHNHLQAFCPVSRPFPRTSPARIEARENNVAN